MKTSKERIQNDILIALIANHLEISGNVNIYNDHDESSFSMNEIIAAFPNLPDWLVSQMKERQAEE